MKKSVVASTLCESAPLMPTEYTMKSRIMTAMVTAAVPLEVATMVVCPGEVEAWLCVTIVTKLVTWLVTVGTPLRPVGIAAQWTM